MALLKWLSKSTYRSFVPLNQHDKRFEEHLSDLFRDAPLSLALANFVGALLLFFLPPFILGRLRPFPFLNQNDREAMLLRMMTSKIYLIRILAYALKGHALVAAYKIKRSNE